MDSRHKHFLHSIATACLLLIPAFCGSSGLEARETDGWYTATYNGTRYFFNLDSFSARDSVAQGTYYAPVSDTVAARHSFSAEFNGRTVTFKADGRTLLLDQDQIAFKKYTAPEFPAADTSIYRTPFCEVKVTEDISYGSAPGYWTSLPGVEAEAGKAFTQGYVKSFRQKEQDLKLDLYQPEGLQGRRPLILFMHGGAFYFGDKQEPAYVDFCRHFAAMGYVTASINYRLGFHLGKAEIERAEYVALQDAHAAMRFLVSHADEYGIDTDELFLAGSSAGGITALNLAFMTDEDRLESSYGGKGPFNGSDLGTIAGSGNGIEARFHIKALANLWGAVRNTDIISNGNTDIVSFHGDADNMVPYAEGYPVASAGEGVSRLFSDKMYGSFCIDSTARACGLKSRLYTFEGEGHAPNTTGKDKTPNANHSFIKSRIAEFFFEEIMPEQAEIVREASGRYSLAGKAEDVRWKVEGGFVLSSDRKGVKVLWMEDAPVRRISACGTYPGGIGFCRTLEP